MANDLRLLFETVAVERFARLKSVSVAAKGMAHQWQIETAALLRLPNVGQLVDEEALPAEGFSSEIL